MASNPSTLRPDDDPLMGSWHHGSPEELLFLRPGSTITPSYTLATVFSHKPTLVSVEDDGNLRHNGRRPGFLYLVAEQVLADDLMPVPGSTLENGQEWLTTRTLRLACIERTVPDVEQLLSEADEVALRRQMKPSATSRDEHPAT